MIARDDALAALEAEPFDLVVIGGGITGAGVALDAASRGYSVALVERDDFAAGTSSRSSKLVHGGLRYLTPVLRPLFRWNHNVAIGQGMKGLEPYARKAGDPGQ